MLPFVTNRKTTSSTVVDKDFNFEVSILVMAKKLKLSFEELNIMTMDDFMNFVDMYIGEDEGTVREATQDDIDKFYAM